MAYVKQVEDPVAVDDPPALETMRVYRRRNIRE